MPKANRSWHHIPMLRQICVFDTPSDLFRAAAEEFARCAVDATKSSGQFTVALSGGSTPRSLYALLASGIIPGIPWPKSYFFWGDERHVPPDHLESNYHMVQEAMLAKVPVPRPNVFRIHCEESNASVAARAYERDLTEFFHLAPGAFPRFDLVLLGLGPDGHAASLFPGTAALNETTHLVVANWVEELHTFRITLTYPVLNHAANVMFLVSGKDKAAIVRRVLEDPAANLPSQKIAPADGRLLWLLDREASSALSPDTLSAG